MFAFVYSNHSLRSITRQIISCGIHKHLQPWSTSPAPTPYLRQFRRTHLMDSFGVRSLKGLVCYSVNYKPV